MRVMTPEIGRPASQKVVIIPSPRIGVVELVAGSAGAMARLVRWWWRNWQGYMEAGRGRARGESQAPARKAAA